MPKSLHTRLPLAQFFIRLENAGFEMNTARKLNLLSAMEQQGATFMGDFDKLKYFLAPLIARNEQEQKDFYQLFDDFWEECEVESTEELPTVLSEETSKKSHWWWLLLLPLCALLWWMVFENEAEKSVHLQPGKVAKVGTHLSIENQSVYKDTLGFSWEIQNPSNGKVLAEQHRFHLNWKVPTTVDGQDLTIILKKNNAKGNWTKTADTTRVHVFCADAPSADTIFWPKAKVQNESYTFEIQTADTNQVEWHFPNDTLYGSKVTYPFAEEGTYEIGLLLYSKGRKSDCFTQIYHKVVIGSDQPYLAMETLTLDEPRQYFGLRRFVWLLILLPLLLAIGFFYRWWADRKAQQEAQNKEKTNLQLEAAYPVHDKAPYYIPYASPEDGISVPNDFYRIADILRRREEGSHRTFDARASIEATIEAGTFPTWRDQTNSHPAEYIVLCRLTDDYQQQDKLFRRLTDFLQQQEAPLTVFYYGDDYDHFWNDQFPAGISLQLIYRQYPWCRLIILGNAHGLVNAYHPIQATLLQKPLQIMQQWQRRLILTDESPVDWSYQEVLLYQHFMLYPADTRGIGQGIEQLDLVDEYEPASYENHETAQKRFRPAHTARHRDWTDLDVLKDYLKHEPDTFRWLCALAVVPRPDWTLTIRIARALDIEVTHDRLLLLLRIPWLADNEPPFDLRMDLLRLLPIEEEQIARKVVAEELEKVEEKVAGSFAALEWKNNLAVQHFALDPFNAQHKIVLSDLIQAGLLDAEQVAELDFIVRERIEHKGATAEAQAGITAWLEQTEKIPFFNTKMMIALLLLLLSLLGVWQAWRYENKQHESKTGEIPAFWQATHRIDDKALRLHNEAVEIGKKVLDKTTSAEWYAAADSLAIAFNYFDEAINLRKPTPYNKADSNRIALQYNQAAKDFNFFLADATEVAQLEKIKNTFATLTNSLEDKRKQTALHAYGLCLYYLAQDSSQWAYQQLLDNSDGQFFADIQKEMPVNLETLLAQKANITKIISITPSRTADNRIQVAVTYALREGEQGKVTARLFLLTQKGKQPTGFTPLNRTATGKTQLGFYVDYTPEEAVKTDSIRLDLVKNNQRLATQTIAWSQEWTTKPAVANNDPILTTVSGIIHDQDGKAIGKAKVTLTENLQTAETRAPYSVTSLTDGTGSFTINIRVPTNQPAYDLRVVAPDCEPLLSRVVAVDLNDLGVIEVNCTQEEENKDTDGDGVLDAADNCPSTPKGVKVDEKGCKIIKDPITPTTDIAAIIANINKNMVAVKGGQFTMGCTAEQGDDCYDWEKPSHEVIVSDYSIGTYEVTNEEYAAFLNDNGEGNKEEGGVTWVNLEGSYGTEKCRIQEKDGVFEVETGYEKHPIIYVSWYGGRAYTKWLKSKTGKNYRLPTEAEWEYAARGGQKKTGDYKYAGSDNIGEVAAYSGNNNKGTKAVGGKKKNDLGLYDMSGNVWEWCSDWYSDNYYQECKDKGVVTNPKGASKGSNRVNRGGSWDNYAEYCRVSYRYFNSPDIRYDLIGFRLAHSSR